MKEIIRYKIIGDEDVDEENNYQPLGEHVEKYLRKGWQPFGSPFADEHNNFWQAMVVYKDTDSLIKDGL